MRFDLIHRPVTVAEAIKLQQMATGLIDFEWLIAFVQCRLAPPGATRDQLMAMPLEEFNELLRRIAEPSAVPPVFQETGDA